MKTEFKFSNLLGTVYSKGNLCFTPDGNCLLSPVGNRVSVFDLVHNTSYTLPLAHRRNISKLALNPQGSLLLTVDDDGRAILTNLRRRVVLYHLSLNAIVTALEFSPCGKYFVAGVGRFVEVWKTPAVADLGVNGGVEFAPFVRHHRHAGHGESITAICWSSDSRFFLTTSKDLTARIWSLSYEADFHPTILAGHRQEVRGAWFSNDQETIYTVSKDGALFEWKFTEQHGEEGNRIHDARWRIHKRHYFMQDRANLVCAAYHAASGLFVAGFSNGIFTLHELPHFAIIQNLSISQHGIDFVAMNQSGEWLAFGASKLGQLLVWEWQSESYILKQQGHFDSLNAISYSPDGQRLITAADDGKLKVWDVKSGFCIVTFTEHTSGVTACQFSKRGNILFTASTDGSIRAWDMVRFRNFRTFTAPTRLSFSSLAVDPTGEVVCAGSSIDSFDIHVWSVQTGQLLDQLAGHEGPVSSLAFAPAGGLLFSGSWDHTVRIWDIFSRTQTSEPLQLPNEILCLAIRPDAQQIAVSTLDGSLSFWSVNAAIQQSGIDARRDISGGRRLGDRRTAANVAGTKSINSLAYSEDGSCLLAGGNSKYVCIYDIQSGVMLKKFTVSINLSIDGTQEILDSRDLTEAGPRALLDEAGEHSDLEDRIDRILPGASRGDKSARRTRPEIRVPAVAFSPTGRAFCAASTEGLLLFSLDNAFLFDPFDLDMNVTPSSIRQAVVEAEYTKALVMAFRLNDKALTQYVYEHIPPADVSHVVQNFPTVYLLQLLRFTASATDETPHLEFNLIWIERLLSQHGRFLKDRAGSAKEEIMLMQRAVRRAQADLGRLADENGFVLDYLLDSQESQMYRQKDDNQGTTIAEMMEDLNADMVEATNSSNGHEGWIALQ